jgi:hypothetical protein
MADCVAAGALWQAAGSSANTCLTGKHDTNLRLNKYHAVSCTLEE